MSILLDALKTVKEEQNTVDALLKAGELVRSGGGKIKFKDFVINTVYDTDASLIVATAKNIGDRMPLHKHLGVLQFLVCVRGKFSVNCTKWSRVLDEISRAAWIPAGEDHTVTALAPDSKLIGICIPVEPAYTLQR